MTDQASRSPLEPGEVFPQLEEAPDGILLVDEQGVIRYANKTAAQLLGIDADTAVGSEFGRPLTAGDPNEIEVRAPEGGTRVLALRAKRALVKGEGRWIVTMRDESQRVETTRRLTEELDARDAALATTSHELRGSLGAMAMAVETLKGSWDAVTEDQRVALVDLLDRHVRRMSSSIARYLDGTLLGSDLFKPTPSRTRVLDAVLESVAGLADSSQIEIEVPRECFALIDPFHLTTIVTNLVGNSLKHGAPPVVVRAHTMDHSTVVEVADSGTGVHADFVATLFDRYSRGADTGEVDGYGLGLWIADSLTQAYGGELNYHHNVPQGARFVCRLPAGIP